MVDDIKSTSGLVPLKDLVPLRPWRSRAVPFSKRGSVRYRYVKVKEGVRADGSRVYWRVKNAEKQLEEEFEIPYEGVFEFIQNRVIRTIRLWFDKLLGSICGLPMPD